MIRINLLPYVAARKKDNVKRQVAIFLMLLCGVLLGLFWYHKHLIGRIEDLNAKIDYTQKELDRYNKIVKKVEELRAKLAFLNKKLDVIERLNASRGQTFRLLDTLNGLIVEEKMWFTKLEAIEETIVIKTDQKGKKGKKGAKKGKEETKEKIVVDIEISGISLDEKTVAAFASELQGATTDEGKNLFKGVNIVIVEKELFERDEESPPINLFKFTVRCQRAPILTEEPEGVEEA